MYRFRDEKDAVVAHFNHGTRKSADDDAKLVRRMALEYGLDFFDKKAYICCGMGDSNVISDTYPYFC